MIITKEEFLQICNYLKSQYGIDLINKKELVAGRLDHYILHKGFHSYSEYLNALERDFSGDLKRDLVNLLSTNHTFFMREPEHFDYLQKVVLPYLKEKESSSRDLAIWCAAAATGQEPYTLAMVLMDFFGLEHGTWDTKVLATDVSTAALKKAVMGIYTPTQIEPLPEIWKRRFFRQNPQSGEYEVTKELKDQVIFRQFNLMEEFPFKRKMQIVFLRNVMIYFDIETRVKLLEKVYAGMEPGGYLFIGKTETLERENTLFQRVDSSIYRKE